MSVVSEIESRLLVWKYPSDPNHLDGSAYSNKSKLKVLLGSNIYDRFRGKTVLDYGCGDGDEAIEIAQNGAHLVIGLDVRESVLYRASEKAASQGLQNIQFVRAVPHETADIVVCLDAFEHFDSPGDELRHMHGLLKPAGRLVGSFGPAWYHPLGGHAFSPFPWSHLLLNEDGLCGWYKRVKGGHISRFCEVSGGLNKMTVARFETIIAQSLFREKRCWCVPIRRLRVIHCKWTREFTTAGVRFECVK